MHVSSYLFISLVICAAVVSAGCLQALSSQAPDIPATGSVPGADPAELALTQSDVPQEFTLAESRAKTSADVSKLALELGWQNGYSVRFTSPAQNGRRHNELVQSIAIYHERSMQDVIALAEKQGRSDTDLTYTDIPVKGIGDNARAFSGKASAQILIKPIQANPVFQGNNNEVEAVEKSNFAEIIFSKGDTFEVVRMTGPSPDTALLVSLAQKAYAKIP